MSDNTKDVLAYRGIPGTWETSGDERIAAWERLQYGMFIHWGPYAVFGGEYNGKAVTTGYSEQIQMWDRIPEAAYLQAARTLGNDAFDPDAICELAKAAGMKYIVMTSKHHDGFAMYDTATTDYNIVKQTSSGNDPLKGLSEACARHGLTFGVYFSLVDWHQGHEFDGDNNNPISEAMEAVLQRQLRELMTGYGPIAEVWFDMSNPTVAQSARFRATVRELQPQAVINSRVWNNTGDFRTLGDNQIPGYKLDGAWQTPASIYQATWGYRNWQVRDDLPGKVRYLVESFVQVQARGGNYLLNIGPRGDGSIVEFEADVLGGVGEWIKTHEQAVIDAQPTQLEAFAWGETTYHDGNLFLHVTDIPNDRKLVLNGLASDIRNVVEDGLSESLEWYFQDGQLGIILPEALSDAILPVIRVELDGDFRVIPSYTVHVPDNGEMTIEKTAIYDGLAFADDGNYNTLVENTVRKSAFIANRTAGNITLSMQGAVDDGARTYCVRIGETSKIVTGDELVASRIGPFAADPQEVVAVNVTLVEPAYAEEDLGLTLDAIQVEKDES